MRNHAHIVVIASLLVVLSSAPIEGQTPFGYRYVRTLQSPAGVLYDRNHDQFFVTIPDTNELLAVSADGSVLSRTALTSPNKLDLSPDGMLLYVTGAPPPV